MIRRLARLHLRRPTVRAAAVAAAAAGAWYAWSPGTAFGLAGAFGGWRFAGGHVLDAGLVLVAIAAALVGSATRERRVGEHLRLAGLDPGRVLLGVAAAGSLVALAVGLALGIGTAAGGLARAVVGGGSWWAGRAAVPAGWTWVGSDLRLVLAVGLGGALAALTGWVARRDDLAVVLALVGTAGYVEQTSALLTRLPGAVTALAVTPAGALRAVTFADRGLAAAGVGRPTSTVPFAVVLAAWSVALVAVAYPHQRGRRAGRVGWVGHPRRAGAAGLTVALVATVVFGATVPARVADGLPWRWQRSWRAARSAGWSSPQVVDRYVAAVRSSQSVDVVPLLADGAPPDRSVTDALARATAVDRQPESALPGPDRVLVRLRFEPPVVSGGTEFSEYVVRFLLVEAPPGRWRIARVEGPVASVAAGASEATPR